MTPQQERVWELVARGDSNKSIGTELSLMQSSVENYINTLYQSVLGPVDAGGDRSNRRVQLAKRWWEMHGVPLADPSTDITEMVKGDLEARAKLGLRKYGQRLTVGGTWGNDKHPLENAYEEALDLAVYLKKCMMDAQLSQ